LIISVFDDIISIYTPTTSYITIQDVKLINFINTE